MRTNNEILNFVALEKLRVSEAMRCIDKNAKRILFLVNEIGELVACITDGDIRRYLLSGGDMNDMSLAAANRNPKYARSIDEARQRLCNDDLVAIPILDDRNNIVDIYFGQKKEKRKKLGVPVVINAGGKGTRLDPFTRVLPKPLVPVGELPIIEHIMREYKSYGCSDFHIIVNYKRDLMKAYFSEENNGSDKYSIQWYDEEEPLGTGGGLSLLKGKINTTFFFSNCDALLISNYESMLKFHRENGNVITMICAYKNIAIPYGIIEMGRDGAIESMKEKPSLTVLINTGIYIVEPEVIDDIRECEAIGFPDVVEREKQKGKKVAVYPVSENDWMDMGQIPELEKMRQRILRSVEGE